MLFVDKRSCVLEKHSIAPTMDEEGFVKAFAEKVLDDTRLRHLREDVSRMCKSDRVSTFPGDFILTFPDNKDPNPFRWIERT